MKCKLSGSPRNGLCVMDYLSQFSDVCVIKPVDYALCHSDLSIRWNQSKTGFTVPENFWTSIKECRRRFAVFPFGFTCSDDLGHANYMVYDRKMKSLERFDPYGKSRRKCLNPHRLDAKLAELFRYNLGRDKVLRYYGPLDIDGEVGIQSRQEKEKIKPLSSDPEGGFCLAWSCWYVTARLRWPSLTPKQALKRGEKEILESKPGKAPYTEFIREFAMSICVSCR